MNSGIYANEVLQPIQDARDGKIRMLPIHLDRISDEVFNIRKGIYTLVGGNTGSGKTSFIDDTFVLSPYYEWYLNRHNTDIKFKVLYRSMERPRGNKLTKWVCWKYYMDTGYIIDSESMRGIKKNKVSDHAWDFFVASNDWVEEMLDYVDIVDGRTTPSEYWNWIRSYALRNGVLVSSDSFGCYVEQADPLKRDYLDMFSNGKTFTTKLGDIVPIVAFKYGDVEYTMQQNERKYFANDENLITEIVGDHVGKFIAEPGLTSRKMVVDKASEHSADARDVFGFSPTLVSQFNRSIGDVQRLKFAEGDLRPQLEDFKESGATQEDADLVLALLNPDRYQSSDDNGMYMNYNINRMTAGSGHNRFRALFVLKNSYGVDDVSYGTKFLGECNRFTLMPIPGIDGASTPELEKIYNDVLNGK